MERQNGGRVSVSVFPTFQNDVDIAHIDNDGPMQQPLPQHRTSHLQQHPQQQQHSPPLQMQPSRLEVADGVTIGLGGAKLDGGLHDVRMVMKHHNGNYEGAPHLHYPSSHISQTVQQEVMGSMEKPSLQKMLITFCSEFFGTYILLFLGCMGCVVGLSGGVIPHEQISFTFGFAVLVAVQCFGHISGAHINPIVTVASVVLGNTPIPMAPVYFLGQIVGAIAGYGSVMLVTPSEHLGNQIVSGVKSPGVCSPVLNRELSPVQGLAVEFIASSILVLVCCAVWDRKNSDKHDSVSVRFGLAIAVLAMAAGPYSGANMNPARSFAPALLNGDWANHWVYWVGPLLAGSVTTSVYKFLFNTPPPEEKLPESIPLN